MNQKVYKVNSTVKLKKVRQTYQVTSWTAPLEESIGGRIKSVCYHWDRRDLGLPLPLPRILYAPTHFSNRRDLQAPRQLQWAL